MTVVLSGIVIESIDRMKDRIEWKPSADILGAVHGRYPHGAEVIVAPSPDRTEFVAVAQVNGRMISTNGFVRCPILKRIYLHAGGSL